MRNRGRGNVTAAYRHPQAASRNDCAGGMARRNGLSASSLRHNDMTATPQSPCRHAAAKRRQDVAGNVETRKALPFAING